MKTVNREIIELIQKDLYRMEKNRVPYWKRSEFEYYTYTKSTLEDIIELLEEDKTTSPFEIVCEYRSKMDRFACNDNINPDNRFMFSLAYDVAEYVIDEIVKIIHRKG